MKNSQNMIEFIDSEIGKWQDLYQDLLNQYNDKTVIDSQIDMSHRTILKSILDHIVILGQKKLFINSYQPIEWMEINDPETQCEVGDIVITDGYSREYDFRELTISNVITLDNECFYNFTVSDGGYHKTKDNFNSKDIAKKKIIK